MHFIYLYELDKAYFYAFQYKNNIQLFFYCTSWILLNLKFWIENIVFSIQLNRVESNWIQFNSIEQKRFCYLKCEFSKILIYFNPFSFTGKKEYLIHTCTHTYILSLFVWKFRFLLFYLSSAPIRPFFEIVIPNFTRR